MPGQLLTPKQVAQILQVNVGTLEAWRARNTGPKWMKLGTSVRAPIRYEKSAIDEYLAESRGN